MPDKSVAAAVLGAFASLASIFSFIPSKESPKPLVRTVQSRPVPHVSERVPDFGELDYIPPNFKSNRNPKSRFQRGAIPGKLESILSKNHISFNSPVIHVNKSTRKLYLYAGGEIEEYPHYLVYSGGILIASYPCAFGKPALLSKTTPDDTCTPEGVYHITRKDKNLHDYDNILALNYPNRIDALRFLQRRLISQSQYNAIVRDTGFQNWSAWYMDHLKLGGPREICIHGFSQKWPRRDYNFYVNTLIHPTDESRIDTTGCVSVPTKNLSDLAEYIPLSAPVVIDQNRVLRFFHVGR